jgi:hypothetical protein
MEISDHSVRSRRRNPTLTLLISTVLAAGLPAICRGEQRAQLASGGVVAGQIGGSTSGGFHFASADGRQIPIQEVRQVSFGSSPRIVSGTLPPRRLHFRGGECLHVEVAKFDAESITVSSFGAASTRLERGALVGITQPTGERNLLYEDFERRPNLFMEFPLSDKRPRSGMRSLHLQPGDSGAPHILPRALPSGRLQLTFYDLGLVARGADWFVETEFSVEGRPSIFSFHAGWGSAEYECTVSVGQQNTHYPTGRAAGWRRFTLLFDAERILALVDDQVVCRSSGLGSLNSIRLRSSIANRPADAPRGGKAQPARPLPEAWIDDIQLFEQIDESTALASYDSDFVRLATGEELFGKVVQTDAHLATLSGRLGQRRFPWTDLDGIGFAVDAEPTVRPVAGWIAAIELAPILDAGADSGDRIIAAIQSASESELIVLHPHLGSLRIPCQEIERVVPQFNGTLWLIDAAHHHLGDEIREDFHAKLAEGPQREWSFSLEAAPERQAFVSLLAADLEPASPQAPRDGPFRAQLAAGRLRTDLIVNGRRIDDLNRHVSWRALPANPQRLRIPVPAGLVKAGMNSIRLQQRPAADDPRQFDDCEISRIALEFDR